MKKMMRIDITVLMSAIIFQSCFLYAFLRKTKGLVQYADWREIDGTLYYTSAEYDATSLLIVAILLVVLIETAVTLYGIWRKSWLAVAAVAEGMLIFLGMILQSFYNGGERLERQIIFTALGVGAMILYFMFVRVSLTERQWKIVSLVLLGVIMLNFLTAVYGLLTGNTVNGSSGWVRLGVFSIQPGEFMKVLLILFSAYCYKIRTNKVLTGIYMIISAGTVFVLILSRDLGNAAVLLAIWFVSSWYLFDWKISALIGGAAILGVAFAVQLLPYVRERFQACFQALSSGTGQQYNSLMAVLKGGFRGIGVAGNTSAATSVTSSGTDLVFNVLFAIFGIGGVIFLLGVLLLQLTHLFLTPVISPFNYMLGVLGTVTFFCQYLIHIGGCLNVFPMTGICAPFLSYGGSNIICSFMIFGGILSAFSPEFERSYYKLRERMKKSYGTEDMEEEDNIYSNGAVSWHDVNYWNFPFSKRWRRSHKKSRI